MLKLCRWSAAALPPPLHNVLGLSSTCVSTSRVGGGIPRSSSAPPYNGYFPNCQEEYTYLWRTSAFVEDLEKDTFPSQLQSILLLLIMLAGPHVCRTRQRSTGTQVERAWTYGPTESSISWCVWFNSGQSGAALFQFFLPQ
jgi:hypothetical protein